jgi:carboxymethylenebutenolidase
MAHKTATIAVDGLRAYLAQPAQPRSGGVLVLPTIVGVDAHMETVCRWLNDAGFSALVWDPFSAYPVDMPVQERWPIGRGQLEDAPAQREQIRWLGYMHEELGLERVGTIGFCLGGRMVFPLSAADARVRACVAYHPSIDRPHPARHLDAIAAARDVRCPVQVMYPGRDHVTKRETFLALREALDASTAPTAVQVYPDADHGFTEGFNVVSGVDRSANPANVAAKAIAWPQTIALFEASLAS